MGKCHVYLSKRKISTYSINKRAVGEFSAALFDFSSVYSDGEDLTEFWACVTADNADEISLEACFIAS